MPDESYILIGRVTSVFGIQGWVNVYSHTEPPSNILDYECWYLSPVNNGKGSQETLKGNMLSLSELSDGKKHGKKIIAQLNKCIQREEARQFVQRDIYVKRSDLPDLEEGFYWSDLEGLNVFNCLSDEELKDNASNGLGESLGSIDHMLATRC